LKAYFPPMLDWFEKLDTNLVGDLLERWASPEELQEVPPAEPWKFFRQHRGAGIKNSPSSAWRATPGHAGHSGSSDAGGETSHGGSERTTATHLLQGIANLDSKTEEAANAHPEVFIFKPLPGAGSALALRLSPGQPLSLWVDYLRDPGV
jgi:hypothetical protein